MEILHRMPGQTFASGSESIGMIGFYDEDSDHVWFAGTGILRGVSIALANPDPLGLTFDFEESVRSSTDAQPNR